MRIVRCNDCGWIGKEDELDLLQTDEVDCEGRFIDYEQCPKCGSTECLMDVDGGLIFSSDQIKELWRLFGDIPINDQDQTEEEFLGFEVGNDRFNIWHWFDERYEGGVIRLIDDVNEEDERSRKK